MLGDTQVSATQLEITYFNDLKYPIVHKHFPRLSEPLQTKRIRFAVFDPILHYDEHNGRNATKQYIRSQVAASAVTQADIEKMLLLDNPNLHNRFQDIGGPIDPPTCIPTEINQEIKLVLKDGNTSVATMRKMHKDDPTFEWEFDVDNRA